MEMIEKQIRLGEQKVSYLLKRSKCARRLRVAVTRDAQLTMTIPYYMPRKLAEQFLQQKATWILQHLAEAQRLVSKEPKKDTRKDFLEKKKRAFDFVTHRIVELNKLYGFSFAKVSIRNQKTRWGSCSRRGNLSFNYKIIDLPDVVADYLIVHELCHLKEMNHSVRFWKLVSIVVPDYKQMRKKLKF